MNFLAFVFHAWHPAIWRPFNFDFRAPLYFNDSFFVKFDTFLGPFDFRAPIVRESAPLNFRTGLVGED